MSFHLTYLSLSYWFHYTDHDSALIMSIKQNQPQCKTKLRKNWFIMRLNCKLSEVLVNTSKECHTKNSKTFTDFNFVLLPFHRGNYFRPQTLTSTDARFWRLTSLSARTKIFIMISIITYVFKWSGKSSLRNLWWFQIEKHFDHHSLNKNISALWWIKLKSW